MSANPIAIAEQVTLARCAACGDELPARRPKCKFDPHCPKCGAELKLQCKFCERKYTPERWIFTTDGRQGNRFCSDECKSKQSIQQVSQEKAQLRRPRQCARKGATSAHRTEYRADCLSVFTPERSDQKYCSDRCREIARYHRDVEQNRGYARKLYDAHRPRILARLKKRRRRNLKTVRAQDRARYPEKKARREERQSKLIEKLVQERLRAGTQPQKRRRGRQGDESTPLRIRLFTALALQGLSQSKMATFIFPENRVQEAAYRDTRTLRYRHLDLIEKQMQLLGSLSPTQLQVEVDRIRKELRRILG